jgi:hypothetical protein
MRICPLDFDHSASHLHRLPVVEFSGERMMREQRSGPADGKGSNKRKKEKASHVLDT